MTPAQFLTFAGPTSLFLGILGILNPQFQPWLWFDTTENIVHTGFGLIALASLYFSPRVQWHVVCWSMLPAAVAAIGGMLVADEPAPNFLITNLESPIDNALHLTFVVAAAFALMPFKRKNLLHEASGL